MDSHPTDLVLSLLSPVSLLVVLERRQSLLRCRPAIKAFDSWICHGFVTVLIELSTHLCLVPPNPPYLHLATSEM